MTVTSTSRPAPPQATTDLYVVATHKVRDRSAGAPHMWQPYGTEHAWRPGTRRTLCGEWISGWTVFWERRFSARPALRRADAARGVPPPPGPRLPLIAGRRPR